MAVSRMRYPSGPPQGRIGFRRNGSPRRPDMSRSPHGTVANRGSIRDAAGQPSSTAARATPDRPGGSVGYSARRSAARPPPFRLDVQVVGEHDRTRCRGPPNMIIGAAPASAVPVNRPCADRSPRPCLRVCLRDRRGEGDVSKSTPTASIQSRGRLDRPGDRRRDLGRSEWVQAGRASTLRPPGPRRVRRRGSRRSRARPSRGDGAIGAACRRQRSAVARSQVSPRSSARRSPGSIHRSLPISHGPD